MSGGVQQIQQQIEELKATISKLSDQVEGLELAEALTRNSNEVDTKCNHCKKTPARESGYVNWNESHDYIKNMRWRGCDTLRYEFLNSLLRRDILLQCFGINENTRFPEGSVFVNVSDPKLWYMIQFHKELYTKQEDQHKLFTLFENHMHTRSSFEEKYKLRWVDPKEQNS